jgi:hypothetical protein
MGAVMDLSILSSYLERRPDEPPGLLTQTSENHRISMGLSLAQGVRDSLRASESYKYLDSENRVIIEDFVENKSHLLLSLQAAVINGDTDLIEVFQGDLRDLASIEADLDLLETLDIRRKFRNNLIDLVERSAKATILIAGLV